MSFEDDMKRLSQYNNQLQSSRAQQQALAQANTQPQQQQSSGLGGVLGSLLGGIGDTITSIGKGVYGVIGTGVASARDLMAGDQNKTMTYNKNDLQKYYNLNKNNEEWVKQYKPILDKMNDKDSIRGVWLEDENGNPQFVESAEGKETTAFKRSVWGDKNDDSIDYNKIGWDSVKSAADVASLATPLATGGMGTGARIATDLALDTGLGAVQGAAQAGSQGGSGEDIAKGALTGGVSGLATSGLNNALNVKLGSGNHKILNSSIGRGALSGAVGGAVGGGTSAALYGQDVGQAALSGAGQGLVQGAGSGAVMGGVNKLGSTLKNKIDNKLVSKNALVETPEDARIRAALDNTQTEEISQLEKPTGWDGEELSIKKKGALSKAGDALQKTAEDIKNSSVYNKLSRKTSDEVQARGSIKKLSDLGYTPEDYGEAAKISETVNKFQEEAIPKGHKIKNTELLSDLQDTNKIRNTIESDKVEKSVKNQIANALEKARTSNPNTMDEYDTVKLWKASKELGDLEAYYRSKNNVESYDGAAELAGRARNEIRKLVDDNVQWGDSYDKGILRKRLENLGANEKSIEHVLKANNLQELKRSTSLFEDGRRMYKEMQSSTTSRSPSNSNSLNPATVVAQESGANDYLRLAAQPVKKISSAVADKAGKALSKLGEVSNGESAVGKNAGIGVSETTPNTNKTISDRLWLNDINGMMDVLGRTQGVKEGNEVRNQAQQATNLEGQLGNTAYATDAANYVPNTGSLGSGTTFSTSSYGNTGGSGNEMLDRILFGMENALNAGDIAAFSQLADIYNTMAKIYGTGATSTSDSQQKLSATQQRANAAMNSLDRLSNMNADIGYTLSGIPIVGGLATIGGNAYEGEAKSLAQQIGYMVSGSNIKQEEAEAIGKSYVPQPFDSEYTKQLKLQRAREIISQYQNGYAENPTETYAY